MAQLLAIGIGILVLIVGVIIYQVALQILDEGDYFFYVVGFFLILFLIGGVALYFLLPRVPKQANLSVFTPKHILEETGALAGSPYVSSGPVISYTNQE